MYFDDLTSYLDKLEEIGELATIDGVDDKFEIGAISSINGQTQNSKAYLFKKIASYEPTYGIAANLLSSKVRACLVRNLDSRLSFPDLIRAWKQRSEKRELVQPVYVGSSPVLENVMEGDDHVDITKFPACFYHELDGGKYIGTSSAVLMKEPDGDWINMGSYRSQLYDRTHVGLHVAAGHHGQVIRDKWFERGLDCPVIISLGQEPSLIAATTESAPYGVSELDVAGWFRGSAVKLVKGKYTDIPIPASSEIAIEGFIMHPKNEPMRVEGPFGEGFGYYQDMHGLESPVVKIKAIWFREDPIITANPPCKFVPIDPLWGVTSLARTWVDLERTGFHDIKGIRKVGPFVVVAIKQSYSGQVKRVADFIMSGPESAPPRILVLVDDDVDLNNDREVFWAIESRIDPLESVQIVKDVWIYPIEPRPSPEKKHVKLERASTMSSMIIDACRPLSWIDDFPPVNDVSPALRSQIMEKWGDRLFLKRHGETPN